MNSTIFTGLINITVKLIQNNKNHFMKYLNDTN